MSNIYIYYVLKTGIIFGVYSYKCFLFFYFSQF